MTIRNITIADLIPVGTEKTLGGLISLGLAQTNEFSNAGILASSPYVTEQAGSGPRKFTIPYLHPLDASTFNVTGDDLNVLGDVHNITADEFSCVKLVLNNGWGTADLTRMVTGVDPLSEIGARVGGYWSQIAKALFLAVRTGVKGKVSQVSGTALDVAMLADAGAATDADLTTLIVSPARKAALIKADANAFIPASKTDIGMDTYAGYKVITSRSVGDNEATLVGPGAFAFAQGAPAVATEVERVANGANGGGGDILHDRRNFIVHPQGFDFVGTSFVPATATAALAMLNTPANWSAKLDTKQLAMVQMTISAGS